MQVFILSPARLDGKRAKVLLSPRARFPLALAIRETGGAPLGEVFSFLSGLYFRGKLAYATAFAKPPQRVPATLIITTHRGLWSPDEHVARADLETIDFAALCVTTPRRCASVSVMTRALCCLGALPPGSMSTRSSRCSAIVLCSLAISLAAEI
ncbi:MAG: hypothetical protein ACT4P6_23460 [Gemmatimonadaceae bacterium]